MRLRLGATGATPLTLGFRIAAGSHPNWTFRRLPRVLDAPPPASQPAGFLTLTPRDAFGRPAGAPIATEERIAMLRHGVPDLRRFFDNDVRVLGQFR